MNKIIASSIAAFALVASARAATIIDFNLIGTAGSGLLPGNEPGLTVPSNGSGGEIGTGITYDDDTNTLKVNVGWGSGNGFSDLTSNVNNQHIHGPTTHNFGNDGTGDFKESTVVLFGLTRSSASPSNGTIIESGAGNTIVLSAAQEADLFNGRYYLNVHTVNNGGGEVRGFLVPAPVPEPASFGLFALGSLALFGVRRRCRP